MDKTRSAPKTLAPKYDIHRQRTGIVQQYPRPPCMCACVRLYLWHSDCTSRLVIYYFNCPVTGSQPLEKIRNHFNLETLYEWKGLCKFTWKFLVHESMGAWRDLRHHWKFVLCEYKTCRHAHTNSWTDSLMCVYIYTHLYKYNRLSNAAVTNR